MSGGAGRGQGGLCGRLAMLFARDSRKVTRYRMNNTCVLVQWSQNPIYTRKIIHDLIVFQVCS